MNVEISNICNLQCSFCPEVIRSKKIMDPQAFRKIAAQVARHTRIIALHLMGDPLVHPKLSEIVEICEEMGLKIFLVSNGLLLREKEMQLLLQPAFRQISFSLHSFPDNFPGRDPSAYLEKIFQFTETAFVERPRLFINYRLWNLTDARGKKTDNRDLLDRIALRFQTIIPPIDIRTKKNVVLKNKLSLHFDEEFTWPSLDLPELHSEGTCQGLSSHFGILVDGTVVPCCLDKEGSVPLGNALETPIAEILQSPRAQAILAGFKRGELVEDLCRRCQYIERFASSAETKRAAASRF